MLSWSVLYGSTAFLIGPKRQVTMMLDPVRIYATAIYLASIIIALFCALYVSCLVDICISTVILNILILPYLLVSHVGQFFIDWIGQVRNKLLTLLAIMLEFGALIWYVKLHMFCLPFISSIHHIHIWWHVETTWNWNYCCIVPLYLVWKWPMFI